MKVLHVIPSISPKRGGPSEAVLAMTRALRAEGVEADIVTTNDDGAGLLRVPTGSMEDYAGTRVCFLPRWSPRIAALREFQYAPEFATWLKSTLPCYDGVHVHAVFSHLSTQAMMIARASGVPYIVRPLGQLDAWSLGQKMFRKRCYYALVEKRNLQHASAIHCTSEEEARHVRGLLPKARTEVIPHGVEPLMEIENAPARLRQHLALPADERVILFLSRWHPKKNIPLLLEALNGMISERWTLVLAGSAENAYATHIHQLIRAHGLEGRVRCPGHVQGDEKALLLQGADAFVLPSMAENFGVAVAEALICGLPAVVTAGVDLAPVVQKIDGGLICDTNPQSLRSSLIRLLAQHNDKTHLRHKAKIIFSWRSSAAKLSSLYSEIHSSRTTSTSPTP